MYAGDRKKEEREAQESYSWRGLNKEKETEVNIYLSIYLDTHSFYADPDPAFSLIRIQIPAFCQKYIF